MALFNYFVATVACPSCGTEGQYSFQADIGVLGLHTYQIGDRVRHELEPRERAPVGPDPGCDWTRPFWAVGLDVCRACRATVRARIEIRDSRFDAAVPDASIRDDFAWGYLDEPGGTGT